jgi:branched-chain amino acid transport system ATP-binding protein
VLENIELGAFSSAARARRAETLAWVYEMFPVLKERAGQVAGSMSGGQQQMVAIARALMSRPRLLMMDEPSLGLAPVVVSQVFATIRRLHGEGLTILLVEQNLKKALSVADRGYVVETGKIALQGTSAELQADPAVRAAYLGV